MSFTKGHGLGHRQSKTDEHIRKYGYGVIAAETPVVVAERTLKLPTQYTTHYDQGAEGACVGFSISWQQSILNRQKYNARLIYQEAQKIDEWNDTPPEEGTSVRAGMEVLHKQGHWRLQKSRWWGEARSVLGLEHGIAAYRWATSIDDVRHAIQNGNPVVWGMWWYQNFMSPVYLNDEWWIGAEAVASQILPNASTITAKADLGRRVGGHAICDYAVSDKRQAIRFTNTWGNDYPKVWMPYATAERMINEGAEVAIITDR